MENLKSSGSEKRQWVSCCFSRKTEELCSLPASGPGCPLWAPCWACSISHISFLRVPLAHTPSTSAPILYRRGWSLITPYEIAPPTLTLLLYFPLLFLFRAHYLFYLFNFISLRYKLPEIRDLFYFVLNKYLLNPEIHLLHSSRQGGRKVSVMTKKIPVF